MKEFIKIKVTEVLKLFSILERDIAELKNTNQSISDNRDYSFTLKKSISDEIKKLELMKESILDLEIDIPKSIYTKNQSEEKSFKNILEDITASPKIEKVIQEISETPPQKKERKVHRY